MVKMLVWLGCLFAGGALAAPIKLQVQDYPPYIDQQAAKQGLITTLVAEAFARQGVASTVKFSDWGQAERAVDEQKSFSFMWNKSKPLMKKWFYSEVIYRQSKQFLARGSFKHNLQHLHNLRGISIGMVKGRTYGEDIETFRRKLTIREHGSDYVNVKSLLAKQQQLAVVDPIIAVYLTSNFFAPSQKQQLKLIPSDFFNQQSYYLVCAKNYGNCLNYIKKFNKGLQLLNQDGTSAAIFKSAGRL
ncbi:MAG: hypothetical protein ACI8WB_004628 [Phenylobacterium sp.]